MSYKEDNRFLGCVLDKETGQKMYDSALKLESTTPEEYWKEKEALAKAQAEKDGPCRACKCVSDNEEKARIEYGHSHPGKSKPLTFADAFRALKAGEKVKRHNWQGYWQIERDIYSREGKNTIHMHCKDGRVLDIRDTRDVMFTVSNMAENDWEIVE